MPKEPSISIVFRCNKPLRTALAKDAQANGITMSDLIRQRLSASLSTPYININGDGVINAFNEIDSRLSNPDFIERLYRGAIAANIILDLHTQELEADFNLVLDRMKREMGIFAIT